MEGQNTNNMNSENKSSKPGWLTANKDFYPPIKSIRDDLKREMTDAEKILWGHLKNKKLGVKFRRQHIVDCYIPDFVSLSINLIIEVDGKIHLKQKNRDIERTKHLERLGYVVLRFTNEEIEENLDKVLQIIMLNIEKLTSN